jgi:hypothetical protein
LDQWDIEGLIQRNLTTLDDLPPELRGCIRRIYSRAFALLKEARSNPGWLPSEGFGHGDLVQRLSIFGEEAAGLIAKLNAIPGFVESLRKIDPAIRPNLYRHAVTFILDIIEYDMERAAFMPEIVRGFVRRWVKFKRSFKRTRQGHPR